MTPSPHPTPQRQPLQGGPGNPVTPLCHPAGVHSTPITSQAKEPASKTFLTSPHRSTDPVEAYAQRLAVAAYRIARRGGRRQAFDVDDVVSNVLRRFSVCPADVMERYTPEVYARVVTEQGAIEFDRAERVQRSEGGALEYVTDPGLQGYWRKRRSYVSGSSPVLDGDGELFDTVPNADGDIETTVVDAVDRRAMLEACLSVLTPREREWLFQVDGEGIPVAEVARRADLARETVSREVGRARQKVHAQRVKLFGEQGGIAS